ncbi:DUF6686 family protein [Flavihumibacter sp. UBA7668]|uniref:DUF6686 family protein n=1 Tax=Flavihumibacter sp. UBA7668 TaxID=1946542 RepID=UPI0025C5343E|nr:DUF6686 family protein [Flavihumibacter sp. UBA7668]
MCNFETLFSSSFGYVVHCDACNHLQVGFGTVCVTFRVPDFKPFVQWLSEVFETTPVPALASVKSIRLPTPCEGFQLLLSYEELKELFIMLDFVDTELQVRDVRQLLERY